MKWDLWQIKVAFKELSETHSLSHTYSNVCTLYDIKNSLTSNYNIKWKKFKMSVKRWLKATKPTLTFHSSASFWYQMQFTTVTNKKFFQCFSLSCFKRQLQYGHAIHFTILQNSLSSALYTKIRQKKYTKLTARLPKNNALSLPKLNLYFQVHKNNKHLQLQTGKAQPA